MSDPSFFILFQTISILQNSILLEHCSILQNKHLLAYKESIENYRLNYDSNKHRDQGWDQSVFHIFIFKIFLNVIFSLSLSTQCLCVCMCVYVQFIYTYLCDLYNLVTIYNLVLVNLINKVHSFCRVLWNSGK